MRNYYALAILLFFSSLALKANAVSCYTLGNGTYEDIANWSCGYVPGNGDTIIISAGDTINVTASHSFLEGVWLCIYGTMDFNNACRIVFAYGDTSIPASMITFFAGSSCINGNGSSGLSFGSGGSGCDVYRPGQGANPGVIPTVPGSYYDGCVWAAYLPTTDLWSQASLLGDQVLIEWSLTEKTDYTGYEIYGGTTTGETLLGERQAQQNNEEAYYSVYAPLSDYQYYSVMLQHNDYSKELLFSVDIAQLGGTGQQSSSYQVTPNPFMDQLSISSRATFSVKIISMDGRVIYRDENEKYYTVATDEFANGIYYIQFLEDGRLIEQRKLVKQ